MSASVAERYLRLGLQLGRHVDGLVDAYYGPAGLAAAVEAEPPVDPTVLVADADALLDGLAAGWLRDQAVGLRTYAGVLAGEARPYADEVEGCYGVRPAHTDEAVLTEAHERLEGLLSGSGSLAERRARWEESMRVPEALVQLLTASVIEESRRWARELVELPDGEGVDVEIVHGEPWLGFCEYLGGYRSRISVNADFPMSAIDLLWLAIHETYPGHHTERCCKEERLARGRELLEETIVLVPTPQSLVAEGIAKLAPYVLLEGPGGSSLAAVLHDAGVEFDFAHALAVQRALDPLHWAEVNAALMLHADAVDESEVRAYLARWALLDRQLVDHLIRFFREETSRTYVVTYAAGHDLCGAYVAREPNGFQRLLTEQIRVSELAL
jgi:hypothetical protein